MLVGAYDCESDTSMNGVSAGGQWIHVTCCWLWTHVMLQSVMYYLYEYDYQTSTSISTLQDHVTWDCAD